MKIQEAQNIYTKFRRKSWKPEAYLFFNEGVLSTYEKRPAFLGIRSFGDDWEEWQPDTTVGELMLKLGRKDKNNTIHFEDMNGKRIKGHICVKETKSEGLGALFG